MLFSKKKDSGTSSKKKLSKEEKKKAKAEKKKKKSNNKDSKKKDSKKKDKKKNAPARVAEKEHVFRDVRYFRYMPYSLLVALVCFLIGGIWIGYNNHQQKVEAARQSMPIGTQLPLSQGNAKGNLKVGGIIVSKDHKHMAVSISYDQTAHTNLSAFGSNYFMWLVSSPDFPVKDVHLKYGFFGTDGNGVLQINSDKPLPNEAFVVMLADKSNLVNANQLSASGADDDQDDIDKSITAQLAEGNLNNNDDNNNNNQNSSSANTKANIPVYYVRLNPYYAKTVKTWDNERELCDELFVKDNLKKLKQQMNHDTSQLKEAKRTLKEYNRRLAINPQDQNAQQDQQSMEQQIQSLQESYNSAKKQYDRDISYRISEHILGDEATKFHVIQTTNLQFFGNAGPGGS